MRYPLNDFQQLVQQGRWFYFNTRRPEACKRKFDWTDDDVANLLGSLSIDDYQKTVPNCICEDDPEIEKIDADQYEIEFDGAYLSLKIAIHPFVGGVVGAADVAGMVTLHVSGS